MLSMFYRFLFLLLSWTWLTTRNLEHVVGLHQEPTQTLARCGSSPLCPLSLQLRWIADSSRQFRFSTNWSTVTQLLRSHLALWLPCCVFSSVRPGHFSCTHGVPMLTFRSELSFCYSFSTYFLLLASPWREVSSHPHVEFIVLLSESFIAFVSGVAQAENDHM